jgi:hypothetical protein
LNFLHYVRFEEFIIKCHDGEEFVPGVDLANFVSILNIRPLKEVWDTNWSGQIKTGEQFIKSALAREPVMPAKIEDL